MISSCLLVLLHFALRTTACSPQDSGSQYADPRDCANTAMLRLYTKYPWDEAKTDYYRAEIDKGMRELEVYGGVTVPSMGTHTSKIVVMYVENGKSSYGEQHTMRNLLVPCKVVQEFTRKAVSWSNNINKAVLACRCEQPYEVYKITPIH